MTSGAFRWSDASVRRALGLGDGGDRAHTYRAISTDTRTLQPGDVFVALRGERFDGHDFIDRATQSGCAAVVAQAGRCGPCPVPVYAAPDTTVALGDLALYRRLAACVPVAGVTGSSGKTTVKDLALGALTKTGGAYGTAGNLNNRVGVPLTILAMPDDVTAMVLELGTNEPGEIRELARISRPSLGVVTTVSETHLERLGSLDGVLGEKLELLGALDAAGIAVVGDEPPPLVVAARRLRPDVMVTGWSDRADRDRRPADPRVRADGTYSFGWRGQAVSMRIPGRHAVYNALLALELSRAFGVDEADAARGVSRVGPAPMRGEVRSVGGRTLLVDCYNANAAGAAAGIATLADMHTTGRRVAVLGTMGELGASSPAIHRNTLGRALASHIDRLILCGAFAQAARHFSDERIHVAGDIDDLRGLLPALTAPGDLVLLKASRSVGLERVIPSLEEPPVMRGR